MRDRGCRCGGIVKGAWRVVQRGRAKAEASVGSNSGNKGKQVRTVSSEHRSAMLSRRISSADAINAGLGSVAFAMLANSSENCSISAHAHWPESRCRDMWVTDADEK